MWLLTSSAFKTSNNKSDVSKQIRYYLFHCWYMRVNDRSKTDFDRAKIKLTGHFDRRPTDRYFEPWSVGQTWHWRHLCRVLLPTSPFEGWCARNIWKSRLVIYCLIHVLLKRKCFWRAIWRWYYFEVTCVIQCKDVWHNSGN